MNLIRYATIQGEKYPINTDFKVAIECDRVINDPDVDDFERGIAVVTLLFGDAPYCEEALKKSSIFLSGGEQEENNQKRLIDFNQHWDLIYSTFKGQYGIDLHKEDMHYQEFIMLLKGVKNTALSDVIDILSRNPAEEKDYKSRKALIEAQNKLKIKEKKQAPKNSAFLNALAPEVKGGVIDG
ncbi:hypothetical protein G7059_01825 [Erysipelothrix sp. HDW6A]|uniref:Gp15 family bacteriophage protein n=1 Tax=Erysipelothrix sp. HDW6A TaxID=2714928 RepID=UPI00140786EC|nr:Gp15 family bacteriophage protein [Erysipelothrix sp. HDW6A]QIK56672.1 hypothetical protein G7059_01825 [Erysipelothrix sp. HDW6A]